MVASEIQVYDQKAQVCKCFCSSSNYDKFFNLNNRLCFRLEELAMENSLTALNYLQTAVSDIIDHEDAEQTKEVCSFKVLL